jgi:autotransporter-associated beta strand protein
MIQDYTVQTTHATSSRSGALNWLSLQVITWLSLLAPTVMGQVTWSSANGQAWLTPSNWTGGSVPAGSQIAQFGANPTILNGVGINFNSTTNAGVQVNGQKIQEVGAIDVTSSRTVAFLLGNSSSTAGATGILRLTGTNVNGVANTVLSNAGGQPLTVQNTQASGNQTMAVVLGNPVANVVQVSGAGNIIISSNVSGGPLDKQGAGILVLTGTANTLTGRTRIAGGTLSLGSTNALGTSRLRLSGGTLSTNGAFNQNGLGDLELDANSTITLASANHTITFSRSEDISWNGTTLTVNGWAGTVGGSGTNGKLFFGNSNGGLRPDQLTKITFTGYAPGAIQLSTGEVVPAQPLPVTYLNFAARPTESGYVRVTWATASEHDNAFFAVERSSDLVSYTELGRIVGKGTTQVRQEYTFSDETPVPGYNYYRLKQVDAGGTVSYSRPVAVLNEASLDAALVLYPNPVASQVRYQLKNRVQSASLISAQGVRQAAQVQDGAIDVSGLPTGVYVLEVQTDAGQVLRQRVIKE